MDILPNEIIAVISSYLPGTLALDKETYAEILKEEHNIDWCNRYKNYLTSLGLQHMILKGKHNWKKQYIRATKYKWWNLFKGPDKLQTPSLRWNQITSIPPEIGQLVNLRELWLGGNQITSIPPEIRQLVNLRIWQ